MIIKFLKKNKKLVILCFIVFGIYLVSLFVVYNTKLFCDQASSNIFDCVENLRDGFALPTTNLIPYIFSSLLILFFVSDRLKRNAVIAITVVSFPILIWVFSFPVSCGSFFCDRVDSAHLSGSLYPITTILTLIISAIYFYFKDKKSSQIK